MPDANSQGGNGDGNGDGGANGGGNGDGGNNNGANGGANNNGGSNGNGNSAGNQNGAGNGNGSGSGDFDPTGLTQEQINAVLEKNPLIWKSDRLAGLRDKASKFDKAEQDRQAAETKTLEEQGKFKELSEKQTATITELQQQLKDSSINQALTNKLAPAGVVDLEAALKLVDRGKITVDDNGTISGLDEAVTALKTDKAYLFGNGNSNGGSNPNLGGGSNPGNGNGGGDMKFKASQLRGPNGHTFYKEHEKEILEAQRKGLIEQD